MYTVGIPRTAVRTTCCRTRRRKPDAPPSTIFTGSISKRAQDQAKQKRRNKMNDILGEIFPRMQPASCESKPAGKDTDASVSNVGVIVTVPKSEADTSPPSSSAADKPTRSAPAAAPGAPEAASEADPGASLPPSPATSAPLGQRRSIDGTSEDVDRVDVGARDETPVRLVAAVSAKPSSDALSMAASAVAALRGRMHPFS